MKINKVNVIYSRTVQMRQFEPATISMSLEAQIDPTDNAEKVMTDIKKRVRESVEAEAVRLKEERLASYDDEREKSA